MEYLAPTRQSALHSKRYQDFLKANPGFKVATDQLANLFFRHDPS